MTARSLIFLPSILLPALAFAQQTPQSLADPELPSLLTIYKDIHAHPELRCMKNVPLRSWAKELKAAGCEVTEARRQDEKPGATCFGVVGVMKNGAGPTVLVRNRSGCAASARRDRFALREHLHEQRTTKEKKSRDALRAGTTRIFPCHRSGRVLAKLKDQWHGTIVFVAQPAEETGNGARALVQAGLTKKFGKPDFALGFHDKADMQTGHIGVTEGTPMPTSIQWM